MDLDIGRHAIRMLVTILLVALALFVWQIADFLLLVFGAVLLAVLLRRLANGIGWHSPLSPSPSCPKAPRSGRARRWMPAATPSGSG